MSKLTYIVKASQDVLNEKTASILMVILKTNFITSSEVREALADTLSAASVNSNIGVLIKKGLIEKSGDGFVSTGDATDIVQKAAVLFAEENNPELLKARKTRQARGVTDTMQAFAETIKLGLEELDFDVKGIDENRSNLEVKINKCSHGIRQVEVRRADMIRIFGYNMSEEFAKKFTDVGFTSKIGGKNIYLDIATTSENIQTLISVLKA
ncbi:transcriptional regulator [Yersinia phage vB_YenM_TG1]|uniref:Transcriptional regulator n=1 Tax=Yersinia phage vB_YenM_TG1 TaxID=1589265 RepID=A0A0B5A320_9CAUD|nr:MotA-like activator of middle period transcription [Yersinia phage vB_YenM_TG1]AJD82070.1 transcriptional regulator [Yersinia phage vB_YenM_TG1]